MPRRPKSGRNPTAAGSRACSRPEVRRRLRLPKEFRFDTDRVIVRREGRHVVLSPLFEDWDDYLENGAPFTDDFFEAMDELRNTHAPLEERESFD